MSSLLSLRVTWWQLAGLCRVGSLQKDSVLRKSPVAPLTSLAGEFTEEQIRQHLARGSGGTELAKDHQAEPVIFVGGLSYRTTEEALRDFFERCAVP